MAALARLFELPSVRIGMTGGTLREFQTCIRHEPAGGRGFVALAAVHLSVFSGQREPRTLVRESCYGFPAFLTVTFRARLLELSTVLVLVTAQTVPPQSKERAVLHARGVGPDPLIFQM
jgi:hypothetical protein